MTEHRVLRHLRELTASGPIVVAHRGDSGSHPENTLMAFAAAVDAGAPMIEFDIQQSRDGVFVCIHDETVDRTTDATARLGRTEVRVDALAAETLLSLDAGSWLAPEHRGARVPTLEAALGTILPGSIPMIEHKGGAAEDLVDLLRRLAMTERVLVQSFDWDFVRRVHALAPNVALGALGEGPFTEDHARALPSTHAGIVHWDVHAILVEDVARLRDLGYLTCVYTANSDAALVGAARIGLDAITTNHPRRLRDLIDRGLARRSGPSRGPSREP